MGALLVRAHRVGRLTLCPFEEISSSPQLTPVKTVVAFDPYTIPKNGLKGRCHVLSDKKRDALLDFIVRELPECYITKSKLLANAKKTGKSLEFHLTNKLPDKGSVMSGDFGEILTLFFLAHERTEAVKVMRKWVHKMDRTKSAPYSDVVILHCPDPGKPLADDFVVSAETKQKATDTAFEPISAAIAGVDSDRTGRLGRCLAWLREKAIDESSVEEIALIERFATKLTVPYKKHYKAVAVIDLALLDDELTRKPVHTGSTEFEVVVLGIRDLKAYYELAFSRAPKEVKP